MSICTCHDCTCPGCRYCDPPEAPPEYELPEPPDDPETLPPDPLTQETRP